MDVSSIPFDGPYKMLDNTDSFEDNPSNASKRGNNSKRNKIMAQNPKTEENQETENMDNDTVALPSVDRFRELVETLDLEQTLEFIELLTDRRDGFLDEAKTAAREEIERRAEQLGISFEELLGIQKPYAGFQNPGRKPRSDIGQPKAPKYRNEKGETWTGLGRKPGWMSEFEANGGNIEDFRIRD